MEEEKYKMIYKIKINKILEDKVRDLIKEQNIKKELTSNYIRILGHDFVKNNKNKAKLIINNKKYKLREFINYKNIKEFTIDKLKIEMILSKDLSNISYIFENCTQLIEL